MSSVAVIGASGYTGAELMRLLAGHPEFRVTLATADTHAGTPVAGLYPSLAAAYPGMGYTTLDDPALDRVDLAFLCLPHGASQAVVPELRHRVRWIVDLAADFRLRDAALYPRWYGEPHACPDLLADAVYGLPELFRDEVKQAGLVAAPGCYVTAATLALAPLLAADAIEPAGIIVDAASGVSGAGRPARPNTTFCAADEDFTAYGLLDHRHTPEIEQNLSAVASEPVQVLFTPHLAPMNRGILATCYARPGAGPNPSTDTLLDLLHDAYDREPFVVASGRSPSTKATLGSNAAQVTARFDPRTGWVLAIAALDNLMKGASGQALQCANLMAGLDETTGLTAVGTYP
ncbi:MAG: N-acetyl-gamma-glutamyl-phosphate reductase [Acidimicrobiales bacterium]